jgi:N-acetylglutamate synthase-like GNAT family acetyltransferase
MSEVEIEIYTGKYKSAVAHLITGIQNAEFGIPITLAQQPDLDDIRGFYQVGKGNFWIAKIGEKLIGTIALLDIGNGQSALRKMFVHKNFRGKQPGVGKSLLDQLIAWARVKEITEIYLGTTEKFVGAQRFYERNGFSEIPRESLPSEFPVMDVDVKFYSLTVKEN